MASSSTATALVEPVAPDSTLPAAPTTTLNVVAVVIGNALEFYDFTVYTVFAVMIGHTFFPAQSANSQLMLSVAVFGVGFVFRPVGALVIGAYADRVGRKPAMTLTIMLMALGTAILALAPGYDVIGIAAPALVVLARILQGISAGGEMGPVTAYLLESATGRQKGLFTSYQLATQGAAAVVGGLIGYVLSVSMSAEALQSWGWRLPFLFGLLIAPVGLFIRSRLPETLIREAAAAATADIVLDIAKRHRTNLLLAMGVLIGPAVTNYIVGHYMTTYAIQTLKLPASTAMLAGLVGGVAAIAGALAAGIGYDRYPRLWPLVLLQVLLALSIYPAFFLITQHHEAIILLTAVVVLTLLRTMGGPLQLVTIPESFPASVRSTCLSLCYAVPVTVFGGSAQLVVTWLIDATGDPMAPAWYLAAANLVSVLAILALVARRRRAGKAA